MIISLDYYSEMVGKCQLTVLLILLLTTVSSASGICEGRICDVSEYCTADGSCNSCAEVCDSFGHNYDSETCRTKCSEYIFRSLYVKKTDFDDAVKKLYIYITVSLIFSAVVILAVLGALLTVWVKYQRARCCNPYNEKQIKKKIKTIKAICVNEMETPKMKASGMKLDIPSPDLDKDTPPSALTTMTPLSRRHPSEDATLEFAGCYDNPNLSHSPVLGKTDLATTMDETPKTSRTETSF